MGLLEAMLPGLNSTCLPKRKFRLIDTMKTINKTVLSLLLLCLLGAAGKGYGQEVDIYVSKEGSAISGSGSESKPFASIQKAIDDSTPNSAIFVGSGLYRDNLHIT